MKYLLISLALWLGTVGTRGTEPELSETQRRSLQVALEEFHKHPPVQLAFQEIGVDRAEEVLFSAGTFVRLEFKLQQTNCPKKDWKKPECTIKPNGVSKGLLLMGQAARKGTRVQGSAVPITKDCLQGGEGEGKREISPSEWVLLKKLLYGVYPVFWPGYTQFTEGFHSNQSL
uniref:Retinoic acid receptor responder protein 2 n=1 Tax=Mus spicilegus TaxID=10103 RepID=A0A8C6HQ52_MUSSI